MYKITLSNKCFSQSNKGFYTFCMKYENLSAKINDQGLFEDIEREKLKIVDINFREQLFCRY